MIESKGRAAHQRLVARILEGQGHASLAQRRDAFENAALPEPLHTLIDKVALSSYRVTDSDIAAVKAAGFSEDQIFELVICAAVGQSTRQFSAAMSALDAALADQGSKRDAT